MSFNVRRPLLSVLSAAVLLASALAAAADNDKAKNVPFAAALVINETLTPTGAPCTLVGTINGTGLSSYGPATLVSEDCIVFLTPPNTFPAFNTFKSVNAVLRTASGEQINVAYCGTGVIAEPTGPLVLSGRYQFTGGSGPFKKASSCGNLNGVEDLSSQPARGIVVLTEGVCSSRPECP